MMAMMSRFGTVVLLLLAVVAFLATVASATEYIVGDDYGWRKDFDYKAWAAYKRSTLEMFSVMHAH